MIHFSWYSVEGYRALVERHLEVEVTGLGRDGQPMKVTATGWKARILQHECDHLAGTLYVDKMVERTFRTTKNLRLPLPAGCPRPGKCLVPSHAWSCQLLSFHLASVCVVYMSWYCCTLCESWSYSNVKSFGEFAKRSVSLNEWRTTSCVPLWVMKEVTTFLSPSLCLAVAPPWVGFFHVEKNSIVVSLFWGRLILRDQFRRPSWL